MSEQEWERAKAHLDLCIGAYREIGLVGIPALTAFILPLKKRFDAGERTPELYEEIMAIE